MGPIKYVLGCFIPHTAVMVARNLRGRRLARLRSTDLTAVRAARERTTRRPFTYQDAVRFLVESGCDEKQVREGSMPPDSLDFCAQLVVSNIEARPVVGLHIGNFVGVSLAYFTDLLLGMGPDSLLVSVDPNAAHRGIKNPQEKVMALLDHFGLQQNGMVLTGYSLDSSAGSQPACEKQLANLALLTHNAFHFCVLDGAHEGEYVIQEMRQIHPLLEPGGLLFMDDVSVSWPDLSRAFESGSRSGYAKVAWDGRVGVLRKQDIED